MQQMERMYGKVIYDILPLKPPICVKANPRCVWSYPRLGQLQSHVGPAVA